MAAWLAYLKSRLLLPEPPKGEEPSAEDLAAALALRLRRLEAIREARPEARRARPARTRRLRPRRAGAGRDRHRGARSRRRLYDLLSAYARQRQKRFNARVSRAQAACLVAGRCARGAGAADRASGRLGAARRLPVALHGRAVHALDRDGLGPVGASLEMVREGKLDLRQDEPFAPLWVTSRGRGRDTAGGRTWLSRDRADPASQIDNDAAEADEPRRREARRRGPADRRGAPFRLGRSPLSATSSTGRMPEGADVEESCATCSELYAERGVNLVQVAGQMDLPHRRRPVLPPRPQRGRAEKLSRAAMETLAIIAYHQPVTRAEIEEIRGVATSKGTLDLLLETGWIRLRGRRKAPGRPVTYGTTAGLPGAFRPRCDRGPAGPRGAERGGLPGRPRSLRFLGADALRRGCLREDEDPLEDDLVQPLDMHRTEAGEE